MALSSTAGAAASEPAVPKQTRSVAPFLIKLFDILSKAGHEQYISWARDGNTVLVSDPDGFAGHVLPKYFKHSNFRSFMRQLNIYGFAWSCSDAIAGSIVFHHPSFVQGRWDLLAGNFRREGKMQRKRGRESPDGQKAAHSHKATYAQDKDRSSAAVEHQNVRAVQQEVHQLDASLRDVMRTTDAHLDAVLMVTPPHVPSHPTRDDSSRVARRTPAHPPPPTPHRRHAHATRPTAPDPPPARRLASPWSAVAEGASRVARAMAVSGCHTPRSRCGAV